MTEPILLFRPRKKAASPPRYYVANLTGGFSGMSRWHSREEAEAAAEILAEEFSGDEIAILAPVAVIREA